MVDRARIKQIAPIINLDGPRYPVLGGAVATARRNGAA